jgi:hypothetical protein
MTITLKRPWNQATFFSVPRATVSADPGQEPQVLLQRSPATRVSARRRALPGRARPPDRRLQRASVWIVLRSSSAAKVARVFLRETIEPCPTCGELTPHSRRRVAVIATLGALLLVGAAWLALAGAGLSAALPAFAGLLLIRLDRERSAHVACERCRAKRRHLVRRSRPSLDGNTEINL